MPCNTARARVRYAETDKMQVAYYASHSIWFNVGGCELLRSFGSPCRAIEIAGFMLPAIEAHCEYGRPSRLPAQSWKVLV